MNIMLVDVNIGYSPIPNLGLAYLVAALEKKHRVSFLDLTFQWKNHRDYFTRELERVKPDLIGFSVYSLNFVAGVRLAKLAKKIRPDIHVSFGGAHPTVNPEEVIRCSWIDSVCIGEGGNSFPEYLDKLEKTEKPLVDGVWHRDTNGKFIRTPMVCLEENLDKFPFPSWDHWDIERYLSINHVFTGPGGLMHLSSRGCFNNCNFCSVHVIRKAGRGKHYRIRSAENIIAEIKRNLDKYYDKGFRGVDMHDALFGADWKQFRDFCSLYIKEGLHKILPWSCMTRADVVTGRWAGLAKEAGCIKVNIGVESADERIRNDFYRKNISDHSIKQAIKNFESNDIHYLLFMTNGCTEDSRETINKNINFIKRYSPIEARMPFTQAYPETDYTKTACYATNDKNREFEFFKGDDICRSGTKHLSAKELKRMVWFFHICWLFKWVRDDFKKSGFCFPLDIIKYIFNIRGVRKIQLNHPYIYKIIKARTHLRYYFNVWKKKHDFDPRSIY